MRFYTSGGSSGSSAFGASGSAAGAARFFETAERDASKLVSELLDEFVERYGGSRDSIGVFAAPARINIIGEHIDYNGGKVFPAAIDKYLYLLIRKRADTKIAYDDVRFPGKFEFDVNDSFSYKQENDYANYLNGILSMMAKAGHRPSRGFEVLMFSTIPAGGGVSSSAALECGFAWAVSESFGFGFDRVEIAKMGQRSEHEFMNVQCGIMDQFIIAVGKKEQAIVLDCDTLEYRYVPLALGDYRIVVMNTNKKRRLAESKYNERRSECEKALSVLGPLAGVKTLCELSPETFAKHEKSIADETVRRRARHCVLENERVNRSVAALEGGDLRLLGKLLCESHISLRDDYEVTGAELDALYEESIKVDGCLGARMTGAGFGGCAIAIVKADAFDRFVAQVGAEYTKRTGLVAGFFACSAGDGVIRIR